MKDMGLTQKCTCFGEKRLQNVAFVRFLLRNGVAERVLRRYYKRSVAGDVGDIRFSKSGSAGGEKK